MTYDFRKFAQDGKTLRVFDFDDTLVSSKGEVSVSKTNGHSIKMDSATFAHYTPSEGDEIDFGGFNHVVNPRKIKKNFDKLMAAVKGGEKVVILTARAAGAKSAVQKFLKHEGLEPESVIVVALASSDPYDKARWIDKAIEEHGYKDVAFYDDSSANARAVAEHGKKHQGIKFESVNTPHPKENDYDGAPISAHFSSDSPTKAVVKISKPKSAPAQDEKQESKPKAPSDWWGEQTDPFKQNYCREHTKSQYCHPGRTATGRNMNEKRLGQIQQRAKATHNRKVEQYVDGPLTEKLDQAGQMAGIWLEGLENDFDAAAKPEGAFKGFTAKDFDDLFKALFGYERK